MRRKTTSKVAAQKVRRKTTSKVAAEKVRDIHRKTAAQFEEFPNTQVPDTMRALAERRVALTREVYERSKNTLQSVLESWEESFGAAGQGALALNRKIIDIAERNINTGFDLATSLAAAKNLTEVMELQAAYWRKQFGDLKTQAEEVRALSIKSTAKVAEQFAVQVRRARTNKETQCTACVRDCDPLALSPSQWVTLIKEVAERLSFEDWPLIDLTLTQFGLPTSAQWSGSHNAYVIKMAEGASDEMRCCRAIDLGLAIPGKRRTEPLCALVIS